MKKNNDSIAYLIELLYPFIVLFGFYVIIFGDIAPGGGFQGGAVLTSIFILRHISHPMKELELAHVQKLEKIFYILIVVVPMLSLFTRPHALTNFLMPFPGYERFYLILMNLLLGFKVCLGLSIIFYEFVLHERRWLK